MKSDTERTETPAVAVQRVVRAFARARKDGWPRCPKCGKRMRPNMGTMKDVGCKGSQLWTCNDHFLPSYWGSARQLVEELNSPNVPALAQTGRREILTKEETTK